MGVRLMVEVLDHAPPTLTPRERWALIAIAEDARDETRLCLRGVEGNPALVRRMRAGRSERAAIVAALIAKGALERVKRGQMHQRAVFRILPLAPARDPETPDPEPPASIRETRTLDESQLPENPDAGDSQGPDSAGPGSGKCPPRVRETRTPSPQSPQDPSSLFGRERIVMDALARFDVTEDEMRDVIKEVEKATKIKIEKPIPYFRTIAERGDLVDYLNRVRAAAERRAAYAARQAAPPPEPRLEPDRPSTTPEERDSAIAAVRDLLRGTTTRRGAGGPARVVRPRTAPETPPEVERAHATLARHGNAFDLMKRAREKLGGDQVHRNEVVVLAAELARAGVSSAAAGG